MSMGEGTGCREGGDGGERFADAAADVLGIEGLLDRLGAHDRSAAPDGFEDRLFEASRAQLAGPRTSRPPEGVVARRGGAFFAGARLAAGVALAGAAAAVWIGSRGPVPPSGAGTVAFADPDEAAMEVLLAMGSPFDAGESGLEYEIDLLFADTANFDASARDELGIDPVLEEDSL